jgi:hypothetical protein
VAALVERAVGGEADGEEVPARLAAAGTADGTDSEAEATVRIPMSPELEMRS